MLIPVVHQAQTQIESISLIKRDREVSPKRQQYLYFYHWTKTNIKIWPCQYVEQR